MTKQEALASFYWTIDMLAQARAIIDHQVTGTSDAKHDWVKRADARIADARAAYKALEERG